MSFLHRAVRPVFFRPGGGGGGYPVGVPRPQPVTNIADLRALSNLPGSIDVSGYQAVGDGGGGTFVWAAGAAGTFTDNGGTIIVPTDGDGSGAWLRQWEGAISPRWFGQKCDGSLESPAPTIAAINYAISVAPATVRWPGGRVKYSAILGSFTGSNVTLDLNNTVLDFTSIATASTETLLLFTGSYGVGVALTGDAAENQKTVAADSTGFAAGNMVRVYSEAVWDPDRTSTRCGELNFVETVPDGASLTLTMELQDSYLTSDTAKIEKLTPIYDIVVKNGTVIGPAGNDELKGIRFRLGIGCKLRDVRSFDIDYLHAQFTDCVDSHVVNSYFKESNNAATAYGVSFADACQDCSATGNKFIDVRHSLSTNNNVTTSYGITRRILFDGNIVRDSAKATGGTGGDSIDTHAGAEDIFIHNNVVHSSSGCAINVEARSASITNNRIKHTVAVGIFATNYSDRVGSVTINDNRLPQVGDGSGTDPAIYVIARSATGGYNKVVIEGNIGVATSEAIRVQGRSDNPIRNVAISGNSAESSGNRAVYLTYVEDAAVNGNPVTANGFVPIEINNCSSVAVVGNPITLGGSGSNGYCIWFTGSGSKNAVSSNICTLAAGSVYATNSYAVHLADTITDTVVVGNEASGLSVDVVLGAGAGNRKLGTAAYTDISYAVLGMSAVPITCPATTNEEVLATIPVPGGAPGLHGRVRVHAVWSHTNSANSKNPRIRFGGLTGTAYYNISSVTTTATTVAMATIANRGDAALQVGGIASSAYGSSATAVVTSSIDTTVDQDIVITGQKAVAGESLVLESYLVELIKP